MQEIMQEIILKDNLLRYTAFPIQYNDLYLAYKNHQKALWTAEEIDYKSDLTDWNNKLTNDEKYFIEHILAFFAGADGIVLENLMVNFNNEVKISEANLFYAVQGYIEAVHSETYSLLIESFIKDPVRKQELFNAIEKIPCVSKKHQWALKWLDKERSFAERLIAFIVIEGLFFSGSFCAIFWLKSRGLMVKALGTSNELIARDEAMHCNFGILLYQHLHNKLSDKKVHTIFKEAVEIEREFITESLPCKLIGMNSDLMYQYICYICDYWLNKLGYSNLYSVSNPFNFMNLNSLDGKTNFFEKRVTEYRKATIASNELNIETDF